MDWLKDRFKNAGQGFVRGVFKDKSIRLQLGLGGMAIVAAAILRCSLYEWLWILLCVTLVIAGEIFNSCIEKTVDYISLERCEQAGLIKDMAAAAVSVLCLFAFVTGCLILIPRFLEMI